MFKVQDMNMNALFLIMSLTHGYTVSFVARSEFLPSLGERCVAAKGKTRARCTLRLT